MLGSNFQPPIHPKVNLYFKRLSSTATMTKIGWADFPSRKNNKTLFGPCINNGFKKSMLYIAIFVTSTWKAKIQTDSYLVRSVSIKKRFEHDNGKHWLLLETYALITEAFHKNEFNGRYSFWKLNTFVLAKPFDRTMEMFLSIIVVRILAQAPQLIQKNKMFVK